MAHTATGNLDELATLAGACNIAHAPDAKDIAALHAQLASTLYHLSATNCPGVVHQNNAFPPSNTPTSSSIHRQALWTSPAPEQPHAYGWPATPSVSTSYSSSGSLFPDNEEEGEGEEGDMMLDSPFPTPTGPNALFTTARHSGGGGSGGRPCTPVLPMAATTTVVTSMVHPHSMPHPHLHNHHSAHRPLNGSLDTTYDPTANFFATSDPFYIDLQQQQQQRSRTLQAAPLSLRIQTQAAGYSVQSAPLLWQNHAQAQVPAGDASSASNPFGLRPRY